MKRYIRPVDPVCVCVCPYRRAVKRHKGVCVVGIRMLTISSQLRSLSAQLQCFHMRIATLTKIHARYNAVASKKHHRFHQNEKSCRGCAGLNETAEQIKDPCIEGLPWPFGKHPRRWLERVSEKIEPKKWPPK